MMLEISAIHMQTQKTKKAKQKTTHNPNTYHILDFKQITDLHAGAKTIKIHKKICEESQRPQARQIFFKQDQKKKLNGVC